MLWSVLISSQLTALQWHVCFVEHIEENVSEIFSHVFYSDIPFVDKEVSIQKKFLELWVTEIYNSPACQNQGFEEHF